MSIGLLLYQFQQTYQHGVRTAYYRDIIRPQILNTRPIINTTDARCEIHVLTSSQDWLNLMWGLKSFYTFSHRSYALCIHDDGTLTSDQQEAFRHHFPQARLIDRPTADEQMKRLLAPYPRCLEFRTTNHLSPKVFDFIHCLEGDRLLLLDSDVLFFAEPTDLLARIENPNYSLNTLNQDIASAYTVAPEVVKAHLGVDLVPRINSGLGLVHRSSMPLDWIENFLGLRGIIGHFWRIEQTLYALCSSRFGVELLPPMYDVRLDRGIQNSPCRHYVGKIRHWMYDEGIRHLIQREFLRDLSQ